MRVAELNLFAGILLLAAAAGIVAYAFWPGARSAKVNGTSGNNEKRDTMTTQTPEPNDDFDRPKVVQVRNDMGMLIREFEVSSDEVGDALREAAEMEKLV